MNDIPPMSHPLSRYWDQPSTSEILVDDKHAVMTAQTMRKLGEYSTTVPSGVYEGKMWRAAQRGKNYLRWYADGGPDQCVIETREILLA